MQDSLIGYLLGALDAAEVERLEARLKQDPQLRDQLKAAARSLQLLKQDPDDIEPPLGLAARTCLFVEEYKPAAISPRPNESSTSSDSWTLIDVVIAASVVLAACMLAFPAINNSRYHANIAGCQNNLRSIGRALIEYSSNHRQEWFPQAAETGNFAVAGIYAPTLLEHGYVTQDRLFYCASATNSPDIKRIPTTDQIARASGADLVGIHQTCGGGYGYQLGIFENGQLRGTRNRSRSHHAIMSDSPQRFVCEMAPSKRELQHCNLLFECGRVQLVRSSANCCWQGEEVYQNDNGEVRAGMHDNDAVIGASDASPVRFDVW